MLQNLENGITKLKEVVCVDEINELDLSCRNIIIKCLEESESHNQTASMIKIQAVLDYSYERINIGNWREVPSHLRKTMTIGSYVKLLLYLQINKDSVPLDTLLTELFKIIDYGLLFGCPLDNEPNLLQKCATLANQVVAQQLPSIQNSNVDNVDSSTSLQINGNEIEKLICPSMEDFYKNYIAEEKPVVLQKCIDHWPALEKWKDQNYLLKLAGLRTVPIEVGSKYTDSEWTQKLMTLKDFINNYIFKSRDQPGYLAQYQLFDHIPELKQDISEPEYCCFSDTDEKVDINAWFGPKGTVSPLHHDPKRNLLSQIVGEKLIYLFSPEDSEFLYPHDEELLSNTARVDPRHPDYKLYPEFKKANILFCILRPGEMLYIPPKWWHFVESLSVSFSVSFWWT